jgi:AcrR family transcriptional regulator
VKTSVSSRYYTVFVRDEKCQVCGTRLVVSERGRRPKYCSRACQAKAYRSRRTSPEEPTSTAAQRRTQIARVVWRIAAEQGLEAVSLRAVAAEAGTSVRVVQYHFGSKQQLLVDSLKLLQQSNQTNEQNARNRLEADLTDPKALLYGLLSEFLPQDEQRRLSIRALTAYYARSLTDPALAAVFLAGDHAVEDFVALVLRHATTAGLLPPGVDPGTTADLLVSGVTGLALDVVHGTRRGRDVLEIIARQLDQLFDDATSIPAKTSTRR